MDDHSFLPVSVTKGALIFFVIFISAVVIFFVRYQKTKVSEESFLPAPRLTFGIKGILTRGNEFDLLVELHPLTHEFHAFDLMIVYDPLYVEPIAYDQLEEAIHSSYTLLKGDNSSLTRIDEGANTIHIVGGKEREVFFSPTVIASVKMKVREDAPLGFGQIFEWDRATKLGDYTRLASPELVNTIMKVE